MNLGSLLTTLGTEALLSSLEPVKDVVHVRPGQVGSITRTLRQLQHDEIASFASPKAREAFLLAALTYLEPLNHEELLVAFGHRRGNTRSAGAALQRVHRTVGESDHITPTRLLQDLLRTEMARDGAEIVLVHNHPPNAVKTVLGLAFGWRPIPSSADRALALKLLRARAPQLATMIRPSSLKWFLVDEGRLAEFYLPPSEQLLRFLKSLPQV